MAPLGNKKRASLAGSVAGDADGDSDVMMGGIGSGSEAMDNQFESSDEDVLECFGCSAKSTSRCPIAKRRSDGGDGGKVERLAWGKTTTRSVRNKAGDMTKRKVRCGEWCRICLNVFRARFRRKIQEELKDDAGGSKKRKQSEIKVFKEKIAGDKKLKESFKKSRLEYIRIRAGGKQRVYSYKTSVKKTERDQFEVSGPKLQFIALKVFIC